MPKLGDFVLLIVVLLAVWQGLHLLAGETTLTSPLTTIAHLGAMMRTAQFWANAAETGQAFALALVISVVGGIGIGTLLGLNRTSGVVSEPIFVSLYSLPKVTLYPLVLLVFGLGMSAKVAFGAMHGLIPVALFTMKGIMQIKPVYLRTARAMRLSSAQVAATVALPAVLPEVMAGVRLGVSLSLLGVLIGEMFASKLGIGFMINRAMGLGDIATIMALALFLSVFAIAANALLLAIDRAIPR